MQQNLNAITWLSERRLVTPAAFAENFIRPKSADPAYPRPKHLFVATRQTTRAGKALHELSWKITYSLSWLNYTPRLGQYLPT